MTVTASATATVHPALGVPATNRLAVLHPGIGFRVEEAPMPVCGSAEVLVRVSACGICGSEINGYKGLMRQAPAPAASPHLFGHEAAGTIAAIGEGVRDLRPGMRIAVAPNIPCGVCELCHGGRPQVCLNRPQRRAQQGAGYGQFMIAKATQCHPIPDHMSFDVAAALEPVACCLHTYTAHMPPRPGERVLILGGGLNAQVFVQLARALGATAVVLRDSIPERLAMAQRLGADAVCGEDADPRTVHPDLAQGADVVVVTRAKGALLSQAIAWCRIGGRVLLYGSPAPEETATIHPRELQMREVQLIASRSYGHEFSAALALVACGRIRTDLLVTTGVSLERVEEGFTADLRSRFKTVVHPHGGGG